MKTKLLPLATILTLAASAAVAHTHIDDAADIKDNGKGAYVIDSDGDIVRDSWHRCVRTNYWNKDNAIAKCEGWKEAMPAPIVAPPAAPVTAAPVVTAPAAVIVPEPAQFHGLFETNSAKLKASENTELDAFADYMTAMPESKITITGHTDSRGSAAYNQQLSEQRANAVKAYLMNKGIDASRMTASGMGENSPIADNATKTGRAENRRVDVEIVK